MNDDVAGLVERLGVYADYVEYDPPLNYEDAAATTMREAVCTIRALVAANSVLAAAHNDTLAKLREAVEVMEPFRGATAMLGSICPDDERRWPGAKPMPTVGELKRIDAFFATMEQILRREP